MDANAIMQAILQQQMQQQAAAPALTAPPVKSEDELRRQRIRDALANFGMAATTTPGNALTGLSQATAAAGQAYHETGKEQDKQAREDYDKAYERQQQRMRDILRGAARVGSSQRADAASSRADAAAGRAEAADRRAEDASRRAGEMHDAQMEDILRARGRQDLADEVAAETRRAAAGQQQIENVRATEKLLTDVYSTLGLDDPLNNFGGTDTEGYQNAMRLYMQTRQRLQAPNAPRQPQQAQPARQPSYGDTRMAPDGTREVFDGRNWVAY